MREKLIACILKSALETDSVSPEEFEMVRIKWNSVLESEEEPSDQ